MKMRAAVVSVLAVATLGAAPVAAQAAPVAHAKAFSQPYKQLVTGTSWSSGGTYIAHGGDIKLKLTTLPKATEVLVEKCEGRDLGDVEVFTKQAPSHVLATKVPAGTCFLILFNKHVKTADYVVEGTFSY
ncbi:hypothetical protein EV138_6193 [Kribbella voronezhensis]|uniref:Uncharacterized protein n=1 Tax=Kribbella voronezhensis TaxID=2512212 RepID=A0A4R7SXS9_9ACTN|nr:hypothetical protein [Kribbella voronezhensis]TDU83729.1 hypothetical protein EV138_6193 [Kribbella voronezhensis]